MTKKLRQEVYDKYGGRCAYTGCFLEDDWQVDHMVSKHLWIYYKNEGSFDNIENLLPALRIVNHYKRAQDLEYFREYMTDFHKRLAKLPKKTTVERTKNRIIYMNKVADVFGITVDKPFCGKFYFETLGDV